MCQLSNSFSDFEVLIEMENIQKDVLFFDIPEYYTYLNDQGLKFADKNTSRYHLSYEFDKNNINSLDGLFALLSWIFNMFGLSYEEGINFIEAVHKKRTDQ